MGETNNKKKKVITIVISIVIILILALAISYAYFSTQLSGTDQIVKVGELELVLDETSEGISLDNAIGISDSKGMNSTPSTFELRNNGSKAVDYTIYLDDNTIGDNDTRIDDKYLKYNLNKNGENSGATLLTSIGYNPNRVLDSGTIEGGRTNTYSLSLWITDEVDGNYSGQVFSGKLRVDVSQERPLAVDTVLDKANPEDLDYATASSEQQKEMWTFSHDYTEQTEALTDYRYIGANPNNYVMFNNELWRIIGVFTVDDGNGNKEERLKIIRNNTIGTYSWDNKDTSTGADSDNGKNNWNDARLNFLLNPGYESETVGGSLYWNKQSGTCYTGSKNAITTCDFTNTGLSEEAKKLIGDAIWYLGGSNPDATAITSYKNERGLTVYSGRDINWIGKVGLMYQSDYIYATSGSSEVTQDTCLNVSANSWHENSDYNDCQKNDWLRVTSYHQWLLTPNSSSPRHVLFLSNQGYINQNFASSYYNVHPTVYLKSNIKITNGNGSKKVPYILAL